MKKLYTTPKYKRYHKKYIKSINQKAKRRDNKHRSINLGITKIAVPINFNIKENLFGCCEFFSDIRNDMVIQHTYNGDKVAISLKRVQYIDFTTLVILSAIGKLWQSFGVVFMGDFPDNPIPYSQFLKSGFLKGKISRRNQPFDIESDNEFISVQTCEDALKGDDVMCIIKLFDRIAIKLGYDEDANRETHVGIVKEICANSIEWSNSRNHQWTIGVNYENSKATFTMIDLGVGIVNTLKKKKITDVGDQLLRSQVDVVKRAFEKKYGSASDEDNRNKGLPFIKKVSDYNVIHHLMVLTNRALVVFDEDKKSIVIPEYIKPFYGTVYSWEITKENVEKYIEI